MECQFTGEGGARKETKDNMAERNETKFSIANVYRFKAVNDNGPDKIRNAEELLMTTEGYAYFADLFAGDFETNFI